MAEELKNNSTNEVKKGKLIYSIGESVESISIVEEGKVLVFDATSKMVCDKLDILGVENLNDDSYCLNSVATEDVKIYTIGVKNTEELSKYLEENSDYRYIIINGLAKKINSLNKIYCDYEKAASGLKAFMSNTYRMLNIYAKNCGVSVAKLDIVSNMPQLELNDIQDDIEYYVNVFNMDEYVKKEYFSYSNSIACNHIDEEILTINNILKECEKLNAYIQVLTKGLISEDECLLSMAAQLIVDARKLKQNEEIPFNLFNKIKLKCEELENLFVNRSGRKLDILKERIEQITDLFKEEEKSIIEELDRSSKTTVKYAGTDHDTISKEVDRTFEKLIDYAELEEDVKDEFRQDIVNFIKLIDKSSSDNETRKLRQRLSNLFYNLYEKVFIKRCSDIEENRIVDLFLIYGLLDERLLSKDQIVELYCHDEQQYYELDGCNVYNAKQWLEAIYNGNKEPSKNEFDLDYEENLREQKKQKAITDEQYKADLENQVKKVSYEIHNMMRQTSRIISGQASVFVPFLYRENFMGHLDQSILTADQVNSMIMEVSNIDYSLFYRERMISVPEAKIEKEYIQEKYMPDIILSPVYGSNVIMWQDIEGRRRNTHARFIFPTFSELDMQDNVIKACGRYRWDICKTIQGASWNNIQIKSLTSEYVDYIQFYRKNHSLSDEKKEKLKMQIQKGRGNTKEVFALDYLAWIKNESNGAMRLNKVARELLAMYCPFNADIRKKLIAQPLFEEAMGRYIHQKNIKVKELTMRYKNYENKNIELLDCMKETMDFYKIM